ncbi:hypothetical protein Hanom_Chr11g00973291 [Helianthus anomalus]
MGDLFRQHISAFCFLSISVVHVRYLQNLKLALVFIEPQLSCAITSINRNKERQGADENDDDHR